MEIYKLSKTNDGFCTFQERYFENIENALKVFDEEILKYKNDKNLASNQDVAESDLADVNLEVQIGEMAEKIVKRTIAFLWSCHMSDCGDEWDIHSEFMTLEKIKVE